MISIVAAAIALTAIFVKARWAQLGAALLFAGLSSYFLLAANNPGAA